MMGSSIVGSPWPSNFKSASLRAVLTVGAAGSVGGTSPGVFGSGATSGGTVFRLTLPMPPVELPPVELPSAELAEEEPGSAG